MSQFFGRISVITLISFDLERTNSPWQHMWGRAVFLGVSCFPSQRGGASALHINRPISLMRKHTKTVDIIRQNASKLLMSAGIPSGKWH